MGKTTYNRIKEFLEQFKKGDEIGYMALSAGISCNIGSDPRTISTALRTMLDTKLIKDIGNCHFKIL